MNLYSTHALIENTIQSVVGDCVMWVNAYRVSIADYTADSIVSVIVTCVVVRCKTGNVIQQLQNSTVNHKRALCLSTVCDRKSYIFHTFDIIFE